MLGSRGIWHDGWKASTVHPTIAGWGNYAKDRWELFHVDEDRAEVKDLAEKYPEKLTELVQQWFVEAGKTNGLPLDDRFPMEIMMSQRPQPAKDRTRYVYYPDTEGVPESVAPNMRNRSYKIGALLDIPTRGCKRHNIPDGVEVRRPRPLRKGREAELCLQLPGHEGPDHNFEGGFAAWKEHHRRGHLRQGRNRAEGRDTSWYPNLIHQ